LPDEKKLLEDLSQLARDALVIQDRAKALTDSTIEHNERLRQILDDHYSDLLSDYPDFSLSYDRDGVIP
jgi:hypothetical protein